MRNESDSKISICMATDNNFVPLAAALIKSIEINNNAERIKLFVFGDSLKRKNKRKLKKSTNLDIVLYDIPRKIYQEAPKSIGHLPNVAYIRLFIPEILIDLNKIIYLDVDMLVLGNLEKLWNIPLDGNIALACLSLNLKTLDQSGTGIYNFEELNINPKDPHFNSGVMVIDTKKWIKFKIKEKVVEVLENQLQKGYMMDQAGLNVALYKRWKMIDVKWNYPPHISDLSDPPYVIHFNGRKPIYFDYSGKHQDLFFKYLKMTEWKNIKKYGLLKKLRIKIPNIIPLLFKKFLDKITI